MTSDYKKVGGRNYRGDSHTPFSQIGTQISEAFCSQSSVSIDNKQNNMQSEFHKVRENAIKVWLSHCSHIHPAEDHLTLVA